jgi:hypothetical protein
MSEIKIEKGVAVPRGTTAYPFEAMKFKTRTELREGVKGVRVWRVK